jgi:hypothetical protein
VLPWVVGGTKQDYSVNKTYIPPPTPPPTPTPSPHHLTPPTTHHLPPNWVMWGGWVERGVWGVGEGLGMGLQKISKRYELKRGVLSVNKY